MSLAVHRQPVVQVILGLHRLEERYPGVPTRLARHVRLHVAYHDETVACAGKQYVETFRCLKKADAAFAVAPSQRDDHDIRLFALVVV